MPRSLLLVSIAVLIVSSLGVWQFVMQGIIPSTLRGFLPNLSQEQSSNANTANDVGYWIANLTGSVTIQLASHNATNIKIFKPIISWEDVLERTWGASTRNEERNEATGELKRTKLRCKEMLQTSFNGDALNQYSYIPMSNGFVDSVIRAYNDHHHLVIRTKPDDVWIAILSQLNIYINAHAEELRDKFVLHEGKKTLKIESFGDRHHFDYGWMANVFSDMLRENVKDVKFHEMVIPTFSTTTDTDKVVASALMMSTLKKYFNYVVSFMCGIPSITIMGTPHDYEAILDRLRILDSLNLGPEPHAFVTMLRPIIRQFMAVSAKTVQDTDSILFWDRICQPSGIASGPRYLGGWISAFSVWGSYGQWQGGDLELVTAPLTAKELVSFALRAERIANPPNGWSIDEPPPFVYEDVRYPVLPLGAVANGFGDVEVRIEEASKEVLEGMMVAGHMGAVARELKPSDGEGESSRGWDTLQPSPQWFMFVKEKVEKNHGEYDEYDD